MLRSLRHVPLRLPLSHHRLLQLLSSLSIHTSKIESPCILLFLHTPFYSTRSSPVDPQSCAQLDQMGGNICNDVSFELTLAKNLFMKLLLLKQSLMNMMNGKDGNELNLPQIASRSKKWCCGIIIVMLSRSIANSIEKIVIKHTIKRETVSEVRFGSDMDRSEDRGDQLLSALYIATLRRSNLSNNGIVLETNREDDGEEHDLTGQIE
ncbi:hypothetical protein L2E82_36082 [Cichorium intybus]|uniref:Uncharacterized protein n=1 Tax=Cichorium intybus TaxID=13427 RepID=A0ACB9BQN0_CICIN|nr:hypothetical protein L2E82_36082 [Cichorium intybus]